MVAGFKTISLLDNGDHLVLLKAGITKDLLFRTHDNLSVRIQWERVLLN